MLLKECSDAESSNGRPKKVVNYYNELGRKCCDIKKKKMIDKTVKARLLKENLVEDVDGRILRDAVADYKSYELSSDVGCGSNPRFVISQTKVLTTDDVGKYVEFILDLCDDMSRRMKSSRSATESLHLVQYYGLQFDREIPGIGPLKGQMMVQLLALFGLVPLEFYTFLPMHLGGGPGHFMMNEMQWDKSGDNNLLLWNTQIVSELQGLYNKELTFNMFENASCEISRKDPPNDLHFRIPSIREDPHLKNSMTLNFAKQRLQFYFRVDGNRNNQWRLQMFAGGSNKISVCDSSGGFERGICLMSWARAKSNGRLARTTKLQLNTKLLLKLDNSIILDS